MPVRSQLFAHSLPRPRGFSASRLAFAVICFGVFPASVAMSLKASGGSDGYARALLGVQPADADAAGAWDESEPPLTGFSMPPPAGRAQSGGHGSDELDSAGNPGTNGEDANPGRGSLLNRGAVLLSVSEDLPAARAGLKAGDIITRIDDELIRGAEDLQLAIARRAPREHVTVEFIRDNRFEERTLRLASWSEWLLQTPAFGRFISETRLQPANAGLRKRFDIPKDIRGLVVLGVDEDSLFKEILKPGNVLVAINGTEIKEFRDFVGHSRPAPNHLLVWEEGFYGSVALLGY